MEHFYFQAIDQILNVSTFYHSELFEFGLKSFAVWRNHFGLKRDGYFCTCGEALDEKIKQWFPKKKVVFVHQHWKQ